MSKRKEKLLLLVHTVYIFVHLINIIKLHYDHTIDNSLINIINSSLRYNL